MSKRPLEEHRALVEAVAAAVRAHQSAFDALEDAAAAALGLNRTDLSCLMVLASGHAMRPGELARSQRLSGAAITVAIDRLERVRYARRMRHGPGRRRVRVHVTEVARERLELLWRPLRQDSSALLAGYRTDQLRVLLDFLERDRALQEQHAARLRAQMRRGAPQRRGVTSPDWSPSP